MYFRKVTFSQNISIIYKASCPVYAEFNSILHSLQHIFLIVIFIPYKCNRLFIRANYFNKRASDNNINCM